MPIAHLIFQQLTMELARVAACLHRIQLALHTRYLRSKSAGLTGSVDNISHSLAIHPKKGHHRGIGSAIKLPCRVLSDTFFLINSGMFLLIYVVCYTKYFILYITL